MGWAVARSSGWVTLLASFAKGAIWGENWGQEVRLHSGNGDDFEGRQSSACGYGLIKYMSLKTVTGREQWLTLLGRKWSGLARSDHVWKIHLTPEGPNTLPLPIAIIYLKEAALPYIED